MNYTGIPKFSQPLDGLTTHTSSCQRSQVAFFSPPRGARPATSPCKRHASVSSLLTQMPTCVVFSHKGEGGQWLRPDSMCFGDSYPRLPPSPQRLWRRYHSLSPFPGLRYFAPLGLSGAGKLYAQGPFQPEFRSWGARPPRALLDAPSRPALRAHGERVGKELFSAYEVFREGAENGARGGRAPHSISEFGFKIGNFRLPIWGGRGHLASVR
jgi:hypothetical protein